MGVLIRTLLIWMLVLALPAQGAASVTMAFCGPNHDQRGAAGSTQVPATSAHSHDGAAAQLAHAHEGGAVDASMDSDPSAPASGTQAQPHTCSACASCCMGAMLSSAPPMPVTDFAATVFATVVVGVDAFAVDGPDRPPRPFLA